jgi:hypothetical protein
VKKLFVVLAFAAISSMTAFAAEFKGVISDSTCGVKHTAASAADMACVKKCVTSPSDAVFITSDNKILKIDEASATKVMPHLGHKVIITGKVTGDTLTIDSIKM